MQLTSDDKITAYNCVAVVIRGCQTAPPPWAVQSLYDRLGAEVRAMSRTGPRKDCGREQSEPEKLIGSRQAAAITGYTQRHANRIAESLGGVLVDKRYVFREAEVRAYAEGRDGPRPAD
jgi:hypothetical protein